MSALTKPNDTLAIRGDSQTFLVAEAVKIFAGSLVVLEAGYAKPGYEATGLLAVGRACKTVDNSDGLDGYASITVESSNANREFYWSNSETDPVTQADIGSNCYVEDDHTVSMDSSGTSVAGLALGFLDGKVAVRHPV